MSGPDQGCRQLATGSGRRDFAPPLSRPSRQSWGSTLISLPFALLFFGLPSTVQAAYSRVAIDATYAQALQTADFFLWAWETSDSDLGLHLISRPLQTRLEQDSTKDRTWFRQYMEGLSNPRHTAFEIFGGQVLTSTRVRFSVVLFEIYQGDSLAYRHDSTMELVREAEAPDLPDSLLGRSPGPRAASHHRIGESLHWKVDLLPAAR